MAPCGAVAESARQWAAPKGAAFLLTASKDSHMKITIEIRVADRANMIERLIK